MLFLLRFIFYIISLFFWSVPRKVHLLIANVMGFFWFDITRFRRNVVLENLNIGFPNKPLNWKIQVGRKSVQNLCLSFLDYFVLYRMNQKNYNQIVEIDAPKLKEQFEKKEGVLVLSLHLGTIDVAPAALALSGYPLSITLKKINNESINTFIEDLRKDKGVHALADRKNPFEIFRAIKKGHLTVFVMDQYMGNPHGKLLKFFGQPAGTATGLAGFSLKTGLPVVPVYNFRLSNGKVKIVSEDPIYPETKFESFEDNIIYNTQKYNDKIEEIIKKHPEQWFWIHKRWKKFS